MQKTKFIVAVVSTVLILSALLAVTACAPSTTPPPTEKVVTYVSIGDYTGPIAGLNVPADRGCEDMFKEINEQGGVDGINVNAIFIDTRYDTARGVSAYKRYRTEPKLLVVNAIKTDVSKAIDPMTAKDKVIRLTAGDGEFQANIGWCFIWGPVYQNAFGATIDFILADWKKKGESGMPTIGYMSWDSAYGREPLRGGKEYTEKMGVNLLPPEFFPLGAADHTVWLSRINNAGADYCIIGGVDPTPSLILRDAMKLGLNETIQFVDATYWGPTEAVGVKTHPEATEGAWVISFYLRGDEAWSLPLAQEMIPKYQGKSVDEFRKVMASHYLTGMGWALVYQEALKRAIQDVGYQDLDGEAMKKAYESLNGTDVTQGIQGLNTYSPTSRQGSDTVKFYQIKGGKEVAISDWTKVPDCVSLHDWSE
jgi:branched-chain amino acid transport system substrate-binding protein